MSGKIYQVAVIVGSLRKDSYNKKIALELIKLAPESLKLEIIEIGALPYYNEDLETDTPPGSWVRFRKQIQSVDAVLFLTPEYNRSLSAVIKNAIDVASRPYGKNIWDGKPAAVFSVSIGGTGAFGANHQLRQALTFINAPCMAQPEVYIGNVANCFDQNGVLVNDTEKFLKSAIDAYANWVEQVNK